MIFALHGFSGGASSWDQVSNRLRELSPAGLRFVAPDLPGHGGFDGDLPASFESCVDRLTPAEPVHLVGYSLGARLALGLLVEHPQLVRSATLIGVHPGLAAEERTERAAHDDRLADELEEQGLEAFVDRWQDLPLFASQAHLAEEFLAEQRRLRLSHDPAGLVWALRTLGLGRMPDYRPRLAKVDRPVCLMAGELDARFRKITFQTLSAFANPRRRATVEVEIAPGAGHNLPLEDPAAVAQALARVIARCVERT